MYRALVVDDESLMLEGMRIMIDWEKHGFSEPYEADSAEKAVAIIADKHPDLLITDLNMPEKNGVALSEFVRRNYPEMQIVYFSGYEDFSYAQKAIRVGALAYLLKPIDPEQVHEVLDLAAREIDKHPPKVDEEALPEQVRYALSAIADRFSQDISLKSISSEIQITGAYLGQLILSSTGKSFATLLLEKRMSEAEKLLLSGMSVSEIASECGFDDVSYFSSQFRKYFGTSPLQYRKRAQTNF